MARFFFDTDDGDGVLRDEDGLELPDLATARAQAQDALPDMAREKLPTGRHRGFRVIVRDESGQEVYSASLTFEAH